MQQAVTLAATVSVFATALDSLEAAADLRTSILYLRDTCISLLSRLCHRTRPGRTNGVHRRSKRDASPSMSTALVPANNGRTNGNVDDHDSDAGGAGVPVVLVTRCVDVLRGARACTSAPVITWPLQSHADFIGCVVLVCSAE